MRHRHQRILQPVFLALSAPGHHEPQGNQRVGHQSPSGHQSAEWCQPRCRLQHFQEIQLGKVPVGLQRQPKAQRLSSRQQILVLDLLGFQTILGTEPRHRSIRQLDQLNPWLHRSRQFQFQPGLPCAPKALWSGGSSRYQHRKSCFRWTNLFLQAAWPQRQQLIHPTWMRLQSSFRLGR